MRKSGEGKKWNRKLTISASVQLLFRWKDARVLALRSPRAHYAVIFPEELKLLRNKQLKLFGIN